SFLVYHPFAAIVTNVEPDHLDFYGTAEAVDAAFASFVRTVDPLGFVVVCADDEGARRLTTLAREDGIDIRTYGTSPDADLRIESMAVAGGGSSYRALLHGEHIVDVTLQVAGEHLARNSAA